MIRDIAQMMLMTESEFNFGPGMMSLKNCVGFMEINATIVVR
jgi:hypothetical protein